MNGYPVDLLARNTESGELYLMRQQFEGGEPYHCRGPLPAYWVEDGKPIDDISVQAGPELELVKLAWTWGQAWTILASYAPPGVSGYLGWRRIIRSEDGTAWLC